jgi:hypothetical protein
MDYEWKTRGLYKLDANIAGKEIEECRDGDGTVHPSDIVKKAKPENSALHGCFEWDNDEAAVKWREQQARVLLANIVTVVHTGDGDTAPVTVRAFVNYSGQNGGYKHINTVLRNPDEREMLLDRAKGELRSFEAKYATLNELAALFAAIKEVLSE